jgi:hypothetical protein
MATTQAHFPLSGDTLMMRPKHSALLTFLTELLDPLQRQTWSPLFPLPILGTLHAIKVTLDYRIRLQRASAARPPLLQGFFTVMIMALGGSTTSGKSIYSSNLNTQILMVV